MKKNFIKNYSEDLKNLLNNINPEDLKKTIKLINSVKKIIQKL